MHYSTSHIHTAVTGLCQCYRVMERQRIWDSHLLCLWLLHPQTHGGKCFCCTMLCSYTQKRCLLLTEFLPTEEDNFCFVHLHVKYIDRRKKKCSLRARAFGNKNHSCSTGVVHLYFKDNTNTERKLSLHCTFIKDKSRPHSSVIYSSFLTV